ncbi:MAG: histidine phosphatase family protein [Caldilineaceae bacterium]|nr:histidine phosphatase family protein [Caldilineaceae bacterium]
MSVVILVRHGETEGNIQRVWHGAQDAPLTARGVNQVAATARRIQVLVVEYPIDAFYVSPLPRAKSTAAAIADALGRDAVVYPDLREFDLGDWEGRTFQDLAETEKLWEHWSTDPYFAPPNGESPRSFSRRAMRAVEELVQRHPQETILIVTHSGVVTQVLANWLGDGPDDWQRWEPENCAISILANEGNGWRGVEVNGIDHLLPGLVRPEVAANYTT